MVRQPDYYEEFSIFKRYTGQIEATTSTIDRYVREGKLFVPQNAMIYGDIGVSDGLLTSNLVKVFNAAAPAVTLYATEPDPAAFKKLTKRFPKVQNMVLDNITFADWMNKYENLLKGKIDFLLNSHTLYHYFLEEWGTIIRRANQFLSPQGTHCIARIRDDRHTEQAIDRFAAAGRPDEWRRIQGLWP